MSPRTSPSSGNRPTFFFEKTSVPSIVTSKTPPDPGMRVASTSSFRFSSAAKLVARGSYPQAVQ